MNFLDVEISSAVSISEPSLHAVLACLAGDTPFAGPLVVLCHGLGGNSSSLFYPRLARALADSGLQTLLLDFRGNGVSPGAFTLGGFMDEVDVRALYFVFTSSHSGCPAGSGFAQGYRVLPCKRHDC